MMFAAFFFPSLLCYSRVFGHFVCVVLTEKRERGHKCCVGLLKLGRKQSRRKMVIFSNIGLLHMRKGECHFWWVMKEAQLLWISAGFPKMNMILM